jgi:hypothetical protein
MGLEDTDDGIWVCQPVQSANDMSTPYSYELGASGQKKDSTLSDASTKDSAQSSVNGDTGNDSSVTSFIEGVKKGGEAANMRLVTPEDKDLMSPLLYLVLSNVELVRMEKSEQTGNRKSLPVGLPGLACMHCCQSGRRGLCRIFPSRRRTLTNKIDDLYQHFIKCTLCPSDFKQQLLSLREENPQKSKSSLGTKKDRAFVETLWTRMGHVSLHNRPHN